MTVNGQVEEDVDVGSTPTVSTMCAVKADQGNRGISLIDA
jgi:hypothetical protein